MAGFRSKAKSKSSKKKKGSKRSKDREWDLEGGVGSYGQSPAEASSEPGAKRARRDTQDRDERIRRGREKMAYRKEQNAFVKKMKSGFRFDVLPKEQKAESDAEKPEVRAPHVQFKSSLSVIDRLQNFVRKSIAVPSRNQANGESAESQNEDETDDDDDVTKGDGNADDSHKNADEGFHPPADNFDWFFDSSSAASPSAGYNEIGSWGALDLFADMNGRVDIAALKSSRCLTIGDIPACHKMFRQRLHEPLPVGSRTLLPLCLTYGDIFMEGCNERNYQETEKALATHLAHHLVRIRYLIALSFRLFSLFIECNYFWLSGV